MKNLTLNRERLAKCRKEAGMTQSELAKTVGVSLSAYKSYESGDRNPIPTTVQALALALGTSASYLHGVTDDPTPDTIQYRPDDQHVADLITAYGKASDRDKDLVNRILGITPGQDA